MSALLNISTLSLSFRVCKRLAQSAAVPKYIQTLFLLCHFLQLVNVCCLAHTDSCWKDWPYGCQLPDSLWQRSCAKLTKSNHEKPDRVELNAASTKRQGKVLFTENAPSAVLQYGLRIDASIRWILLTPICSKGAEGDLAAEETE